MSTLHTSHTLPTWAARLGYAGLIPFVALAALAVWMPAFRLQLQWALAAYGAVIVSFLGALHWGWVMREEAPLNPSASLIWGVTPSLLAWLALLLPTALSLYVLAASLWLCYAVDRRSYPPRQLTAWLPMRLRLTSLASLSCVVGALA
jgi:Protein of unknown function (DUF3429)